MLVLLLLFVGHTKCRHLTCWGFLCSYQYYISFSGILLGSRIIFLWVSSLPQPSNICTVFTMFVKHPYQTRKKTRGNGELYKQNTNFLYSVILEIYRIYYNHSLTLIDTSPKRRKVFIQKVDKSVFKTSVMVGISKLVIVEQILGGGGLSRKRFRIFGP